MSTHSVLIGCAGWNVPKDAAAQFPEFGTHLQRYAARFPAVEISSSFYRPHRCSTYEKWSASVTQKRVIFGTNDSDLGRGALTQGARGNEVAQR